MNQLDRDRQCGEYLDLGPVEGDENQQWQIYSADSDQFETVTAAGLDLTLKGQSQAPILMVGPAGNPVYRGAESARAALANVEEARKGDYHRVLLRPHATWRMSSCVVLKKGEELGCTFHGNHSFLLQSGT